MTIQKYFINCSECKKKTPHIIYRLSRKKGILLKCFECGNIKKQYQKLNNLEEKEIKEGAKKCE